MNFEDVAIFFDVFETFLRVGSEDRRERGCPKSGSKQSYRSDTIVNARTTGGCILGLRNASYYPTSENSTSTHSGAQSE